MRNMRTIQRSGERHFSDHGWLRTHYSFSFADYYDPKNERWGALRVFNDDSIAPSSGFPPHPHRDMEILTYVFSGSLEHQDSMGNHGVVRAGGVQFMSAGTGVRHSEFNASKDEPLHLVQMWVLPGEVGRTPLYGQMDFSVDDRRDRWLTVASGQRSVDAPIALTQSATLRVARLDGTHVSHVFEPQRYGFAFVGDGEIAIDGEALQKGDALRTYDEERLRFEGVGELVFWDVAAGA
ncbi:MAG: pirin family protein [Candidatus Eremiobacteraeota bacterium]|nr:pirin family protein [Candidatus Eremiobacteraeota bacterium]